MSESKICLISDIQPLSTELRMAPHTGDGDMFFQKTKSSEEKKKKKVQKLAKKVKDRKRYLLKKKVAGQLSSKEQKELNKLEK